MKTKKPLIVRIVIWVCVIAMVVSLIWVYVVYMFAPTENTVEESINENQQEDIVSNDAENSEENIELEINDENIENVENTDNEEFNYKCNNFHLLGQQISSYIIKTKFSFFIFFHWKSYNY